MEKQLKITKSDVKPESVYANGVSVNFSMFEARIEFVKDTPNPANGEIIQETVADIRVSPQLAKALAAFLDKNVEMYESDFEKLPVIGMQKLNRNLF